MYTSAHTSSGLATMMASTYLLGDSIVGLSVGAAAGFVSHFLLDYLGEKPYKNVNTFEFIYLALFALAGIISGKYYLVILGFISGNFPDIVDKWYTLMEYFKTGKLKWNPKPYFSCHNGSGPFIVYKGTKLGFPVKWKLTSNQTMYCNLISVILSLGIFSILIYKNII